MVIYYLLQDAENGTMADPGLAGPLFWPQRSVWEGLLKRD